MDENKVGKVIAESQLAKRIRKEVMKRISWSWNLNKELKEISNHAITATMEVLLEREIKIKDLKENSK